MPASPILGTAYSLRSKNLDSQRSINLYLESAELPGGSAPAALVACPGLVPGISLETTPLPYIVGWEYLANPTEAGTVIGLHTFPPGLSPAPSFPANFAGSGGETETNPTDDYTITIVNQEAVSIGTIGISTSGDFTFTTEGGVSIAANPGDTWIATGGDDATLENFTASLLGTLSSG